MGNTQTSDGTFKPLAIAALARQVCVKRSQIITLRDTFVVLSSKDEMISRNDFYEALKLANITREDDLEILDLLFTMWDAEGYDKVPFKEFSMGISPLACPDESPKSILRFALEVSDQEKTGLISPEELEDLLLSIDSTASYFGDPHLKYKCIRRVVDAVFEDEKGEEIMHQLCVKKLLQNAYIRRFIMGRNNTRVTFEVGVKKQTSGSPSNRAATKQRAKVSSFAGPYQPPSPANIVGSLLDTWSLSTSESGTLSPLSSPRMASSSLGSLSSPLSSSSPRSLSSPRHRSGIPSSPRGREPPSLRRPHFVRNE